VASSSPDPGQERHLEQAGGAGPHRGDEPGRGLDPEQPGQTRLMSWYSVTRGGGGGRTSVTCRRWSPLTAAPASAHSSADELSTADDDTPS